MRCLRFVAVFTVIALMIPFTSLHYITDSDVRNNSPIISHDSVEPDYDSEIKRVDPATPVSLSEEVNPSLDPVLGTLNPTTIEQSGYSCTGNITARTDTHLNTQQELSIDTAHDWVASSADVRLWNLEQLYALNGTFEQGLPGINIQPNGTADYYPFGWTSNSTDTPTYSDDVQLSSYESGDDTFIAVENIGGKVGQNEFGHDAGIKITWAQTIQNIPYTEDFLLNFNFFYLRGPLNLNPSDPITGNCSIYVYIDGVPIWNMSLLTLSERGVWNDIGIIPIHLTGVPVSFVFEIGLEVDETLILDKRKDYDNNGLEDGTLYTQYITVYFDDLSFIAATPPSCDVVGLEFSVDGLIGEIVGTGGIGYGIIANTDYWVSSPLAFSIYSNTSVSFDYCIDLLNHRFINSSWRTDVSSIGVQYSVTSGNSADLNLYTYLGIIGVYDNLTLRISTPSDWENITVLDPFLSDVTIACLQYDNIIEIPTDVLDVLGWWKISCQSPNYGNESQAQRYDTDVGSWVEDIIYHTGDKIRLSANISSQGNIPSLSDGVSFKWGLPNYTIWYESYVTSESFGSISSTSTTFGATNTTAGQWYISYFWTNGTEVAYGTSLFEVQHSTTLTSYETIIRSESGLSITNFVYFQDSENGEFIMDSSASVTANWSTTTVTFVPDIIQNRWVGTFDTSLVEPGDNLVVVNASRSYFDDASCTFIVRISYTGNQLKISDPTAEIGLGEKHTAYFTYSDAYGSGIIGANVSIEYSGIAGGITWGTVFDLGGGDYSIEFTSVHSGSYAITITASTDYYEVSQDALFLFVGAVTTNLNLENGTSAIIGFGEQYRLVLRYTNTSDYGLDGANVSIVSSTPATGISYGSINSEGDGYYSIILTPEDSDTFTLLVRISLADHTTQYASFTLTATLISTHLRVSGTSSPATIGVEQPMDLLVFYEQTGVIGENISQADIHLTFTSYANLTYTITPLTEGYLISLQTDKIGSYTFNIFADKAGFQSDFVTFTLFVRARGMQVNIEPPVWTRLSSLEITLSITDSITNESITDAIASYLLLKSGVPIMDGNLTESEVTPGVYSVTINPDWLDGTGYSIKISAVKPNFELDGDYEFPVLQYTPPDILIQLMVAIYGPPIGIIAVVAIVTIVGQRSHSKKQNAKRMKARAIKSRFDDANNLLGIIVLHKLSGIPIYSKILKGGFEEGMLSAFITAIMHFRSEFDTARDASDEYRILPISDIIRAIPTQNLICAFITISSSSPEQEAKMVGYARAIGMTMDDILSQRPTQIVDVKTAKTLEWYFDDFVDGGLIRKYQVSEKKIPRRFKIIESTMPKDSSRDTFSLRRLIRNLEASGLSEDDVYLFVMDAIEGEFIVPVYSSNGI